MAAKVTTIQNAVLIPSYVRQHKGTAQRGKVIDQGGNKFSETTRSKGGQRLAGGTEKLLVSPREYDKEGTSSFHDGHKTWSKEVQE